MVYFEKTLPAPDCLAKEKAKKAGDYKCGNVLAKLQEDFKNKCYICEIKAPTTINVEHLIPHKGNKDLKFDWHNLFWSCGHCNNTKLAKYDNILNCTDPNDDIEHKLKYIFKPFPAEKVNITPLDSSPKTLNTKDLLLAIYNGTTNLKIIESANLRKNLLDEIIIFSDLLRDYFSDTNTADESVYFLIKIKGHLNRASNFTAFKRWIILDNKKLKTEFEKYFS